MKKRALLLCLLLGGSQLSAQAASGPYVVQESGTAFGKLQEAVDSIGSGSGTILIGPGTYNDCAVQSAGRISFLARRPGTAIFDGTVCEGKASLVLRGGGARVAGLVFQNLRVPDGNGAGIRLEGSSLTVSDSIFRDSESGILAGDDETGAITVEGSTFSGLGRCDRGLSCAHSIYIGKYALLKVIRSRFERGTGGHYVKARSGRVEILDSSFDDTRGRATNYMIDLSEGASGLILGNVFVQGKDKENYSAMIMVAAEGKTHSSAGLEIRENHATIAPGVDRATSFVANASGESLTVRDNRLGPAIRAEEHR